MSTRPVFGVTPPPPTRSSVRGRREAAWNDAYRKADSLYTAKPCGCLVLIMVDLPDVIRDSSKEIAREAAKGRLLQRVPRGTLPPLNCPTHSEDPA